MMAARKQHYWENENALETGEPEPIEEYPSESRVVSGSVWMLAIDVALFFLPVVNGVIAGVIGGYRVGSPKNALMAALGPLVFATCLLWMALSLLPIPSIGIPLNQINITILVALSDIGLLLGASIGGSIAQHRFDRMNRV